MEICRQGRDYVGLFGTCGNSTWRQPFIDRYKALKIPFFNPQLPDGTWTPADSEKEVLHLANDDIIVFVITDETYAFVSLVEAGLIIGRMQNSHRKLVIFIDQELDNSLIEADVSLAKASILMREMLIKHLKTTTDNVFVTKTLSATLEMSVLLYNHKLGCTALAQEVM